MDEDLERELDYADQEESEAQLRDALIEMGIDPTDEDCGDR